MRLSLDWHGEKGEKKSPAAINCRSEVIFHSRLIFIEKKVRAESSEGKSRSIFFVFSASVVPIEGFNWAIHFNSLGKYWSSRASRLPNALWVCLCQCEERENVNSKPVRSENKRAKKQLPRKVNFNSIRRAEIWKSFESEKRTACGEEILAGRREQLKLTEKGIKSVLIFPCMVFVWSAAMFWLWIAF